MNNEQHDKLCYGLIFKTVMSVCYTYYPMQCPMVELLDNPNHRGTFQTMRSVASITARENDTNAAPHFGFFYVVLSVLPTDGVDGSCVSTAKGTGDELILLRSAINNFDPTPYSGLDRTKTVNITVELGMAILCVYSTHEMFRCMVVCLCI